MNIFINIYSFLRIFYTVDIYKNLYLSLPYKVSDGPRDIFLL